MQIKKNVKFFEILFKMGIDNPPPVVYTIIIIFRGNMENG